MASHHSLQPRGRLLFAGERYTVQEVGGAGFYARAVAGG